MNKLTCVIIDDEPYAIKALTGYIDQIPTLQVTKIYTDPVEAMLDFTATNQVDLVLLDIDMPKISGIELSREIRQKTKKLVFTTAYTKYGYEAFEADADGYLLKPYSFPKFAATIAKIFPQKSNSTDLHDTRDFFFVKNKEEQLKMVKIKINEIIGVESKQNYVRIYTTNKNVLTYMSLTDISKILSPYPNFVQYQRSFIVSQEYIEYIVGNTIKLVNGLEFTVGEYYRKDFTAFLSNNLINAKRKS